MLDGEKKWEIGPFNAKGNGRRGLDVEDDEEATGGLDRRGSKLEVVEHPSQGILGPAIEEHEQYEATDVQIWKNSSFVIHAATRATNVEIWRQPTVAPLFTKSRERER